MAEYTETDLSKYIPNADIDSYYFTWIDDVRTDTDNYVVGYIRNETNPDISVSIEIDDKWMKENHYRTTTLYINPDDYLHGCAVVLTTDFFTEMKSNPYLMASIWHEIGHFHTIHYWFYMSDGQSMNAY